MPARFLPLQKNFCCPRIINMPNMGVRSYIFAKACGVISKSFTGRRIHRLESVDRLSELDRMVFHSASRGLPEKELLIDLEDRIIERAVDSIISLVDNFSQVPEFIALLVRSYEYADVKNILTAFLEGEKSLPAYIDLGRFRTVRFENWPDIAGMIRGTDFEFLLDREGNLNQESGISLQTVLDRHYYRVLWESLCHLPARDRLAAEKILAAEISLRNSGWALRLQTYYGMPAQEVISHLVDIPVRRNGRGQVKSGKESLAGDAIKSLDFSLDMRRDWNSWRWEKFLNPETPDAHWHADPRFFQNAASLYLYRLAKHYFRLSPFSLDTVFCFIKLKQFEEDILTSCAEGLGMGISCAEIITILRIES